MSGKDLGRRFDCMCTDVADLEGVANALDWAEYRVGVCRTLVNATFQAFDTAGMDVEDVTACSNLMQAVDDLLVTIAQQIGRIQDGVVAMETSAGDGAGNGAGPGLGSD